MSKQIITSSNCKRSLLPDIKKLADEKGIALITSDGKKKTKIQLCDDIFTKPDEPTDKPDEPVKITSGNCKRSLIAEIKKLAAEKGITLIRSDGKNKTKVQLCDDIFVNKPIAEVVKPVELSKLESKLESKLSKCNIPENYLRFKKPELLKLVEKCNIKITGKITIKTILEAIKEYKENFKEKASSMPRSPVALSPVALSPVALSPVASIKIPRVNFSNYKKPELIKFSKNYGIEKNANVEQLKKSITDIVINIAKSYKIEVDDLVEKLSKKVKNIDVIDLVMRIDRYIDRYMSTLSDEALENIADYYEISDKKDKNEIIEIIKRDSIEKINNFILPFAYCNKDIPCESGYTCNVNFPEPICLKDSAVEKLNNIKEFEYNGKKFIGSAKAIETLKNIFESPEKTIPSVPTESVRSPEKPIPSVPILLSVPEKSTLLEGEEVIDINDGDVIFTEENIEDIIYKKDDKKADDFEIIRSEIYKCLGLL
jgi:hypothetical protein